MADTQKHEEAYKKMDMSLAGKVPHNLEKVSLSFNTLSIK